MYSPSPSGSVRGVLPTFQSLKVPGQHELLRLAGGPMAEGHLVQARPRAPRPGRARRRRGPAMSARVGDRHHRVLAAEPVRRAVRGVVVGEPLVAVHHELVLVAAGGEGDRRPPRSRRSSASLSGLAAAFQSLKLPATDTEPTPPITGW